MTSPKRSDRWHRLDKILGGLDSYVARRRGDGDSWNSVAMSIAIAVADHPDVQAPTVATLTRWYPSDREQVTA